MLHVRPPSFPTRRSSDLLSVVAAFLLFGMLDSVRVAFTSGSSVAGANRLVVASRLSITQTLPYRLLAQIEARSEEHTSELQSLMRISYAVFCLKKKNTTYTTSRQTK